MTPLVDLRYFLIGTRAANWVNDTPLSPPSMCICIVDPSQEPTRCACARALLTIALYRVSTVLMTAPVMARAASQLSEHVQQC